MKLYDPNKYNCRHCNEYYEEGEEKTFIFFNFGTKSNPKYEKLEKNSYYQNVDQLDQNCGNWFYAACCPHCDEILY